MEQTSTGVDIRKIPWKWGSFLAAGLLLIGWLLNTPTGFLEKADAIGYAVCHRIEARSFHVAGRALPLCVRCTGMYLGAMLGLIYLAAFSPRRAGVPPVRVLLPFVFMVLAFGVDGLNSYLHLFSGFPSLYEPQHSLRLLTGTGMGLTIAAAVWLAFNQTVWQRWDERPVLDGWRSLLGLLLIAVLFDALVLTENALVLYPIAFVSAGGVLVLLTIVYSVVWLMLSRQENRYLALSQLIVPLSIGFTVGLAQIALFDLLRFLLTGTWDGFHFG